jgi:hypothetical protein
VGLPFRLDELGSLEFERLCAELLGLDERRLLVVWARNRDHVYDAVARTHPAVLATNLPDVVVPDVKVLGPTELWGLFAASPRARLRAPSALGVADLDALIAPDVAARSTADIAAAAELARVFVPTRAYARALVVLEQHHFAVLTGPPEMGKTAIACMIGLAGLTNGWEMHECVRPDDLWSRFDRDRPQVFVADDAFGSTEYRPETAERWAVDLDRVLRAMDERHWLVWTSRPAPFRAGLRRIHREHGVERFPQPAEIGVDAAELDVTEKALILFRHAKRAALPERTVQLVKVQGWSIASHEYFTPERIRRFVGGRLRELGEYDKIRAAVAREIREPTEAMASSYRALAPEQRAVLLALLDVAPGPVTERDLIAVVRRHWPSGLEHPVNEIVDRLADHFLRLVHPASVTWVHPSWRDLVIEELAADTGARGAFLHACGIFGIAVALSTAGGVTGERSLPLLVDDADWDTVAGRLASLVPELDSPGVTVLLAVLDEARRAAESEGTALAADVLSQLAHSWNRRCDAVPVGVLSAWFDLAAELPEPPEPPSPAATWFDLVPTEPIDVVDDAFAFDDWTALVQLLAERAPESLAAFGFPDKQRLAITQFVAQAASAADLEAEPVARSLLRLAALGVEPEFASKTAYGLRYVRDPDDLEMVELRPLSPELERILEAPLPSAGTERAQVERVLRDL